MLQCMAEVGEDMVGLPLLKFGGGGGGGSSTFNAKQCCAAESLFFLQSEGFELSFYFKSSFISYQG